MENKKLAWWIVGAVTLILVTAAIIQLARSGSKPGPGFKSAGKYLNSRVQSRDRAHDR